MKWVDGPPPDDSYGLYLCVLDAGAVRKRYAVAVAEYNGEPVAVHWWGHKGKDTLRQTRIDPDLVVKHVAIPAR